MVVVGKNLPTILLRNNERVMLRPPTRNKSELCSLIGISESSFDRYAKDGIIPRPDLVTGKCGIQYWKFTDSTRSWISKVRKIRDVAAQQHGDTRITRISIMNGLGA